jgi:hypothetical protein
MSMRAIGKKIIQYLSDLLIGSVFIGVCLIWPLGSVITSPRNAISINREYRISAYPSGPALYRIPYSHLVSEYYGFSPYNDFLLTQTLEQSAVLEWDSSINQEDEAFSIEDFWTEMRLVVEEYLFGFPKIVQQFHTKQGRKVEVAVTKVTNSQLLISKTVDDGDHASDPAAFYGHVLNVATGDLIVDIDSKSIINPLHADLNTYSPLLREMGYEINEERDFSGQRIPLNSRRLAIINPQRAGVILITTRNDQELYFDSTWHSVVILESVKTSNDRINSSFQVEFRDNLMSI